MKVILFYDITDSSRLNKTRKEVTKFLRHIQYSVFEGELEKHELKALELAIKDIIDTDTDSVIIFTFSFFKDENKTIIGVNKNNFNGMVI